MCPPKKSKYLFIYWFNIFGGNELVAASLIDTTKLETMAAQKSSDLVVAMYLLLRLHVLIVDIL